MDGFWFSGILRAQCKAGERVAELEEREKSFSDIGFSFLALRACVRGAREAAAEEQGDSQVNRKEMLKIRPFEQWRDMAFRAMELCEDPAVRWPDGVARAGFEKWGDFNVLCWLPDCKDLAERYRETVAIREARRKDGKRARMEAREAARMDREAARMDREAEEIGRAAIRKFREKKRKASAKKGATPRKKRQAKRGGPSTRAVKQGADRGRGQLTLFGP